MPPFETGDANTRTPTVLEALAQNEVCPRFAFKEGSLSTNVNLFPITSSKSGTPYPVANRW